ncbi:MAG: PilZ domain-containing protein [Actinomycetota bacterium]|nr:PilZ domain-containing protein [Actinomycetota bacterium]
MSLLRDGTRIFVDTSISSRYGEAAFVLPATARPATLMYLAGRSARIIMDGGQPPLPGTDGVIYRRIKFGLFAAPVKFSASDASGYRAFEAVLLNPGAVLQRREYVRVQTVLGISVFALEAGRAKTNFTTVAIDISQGGMRIRSKDNMRVGQELKISFLIDGSAVGVNSVVRSNFPDGTLGVEFVSVPADVKKSLCRFIYKTQVSQNPNLGRDMQANKGGVEICQDLMDADEYWDIFSEGTLESIAVSTDYREFNKIVFGSFGSAMSM